MSDYPDIPQAEGTRPFLFEDIVTQLSPGGVPNIFVGFGGDIGIGRYLVFHEGSPADLATLQAHRTAHELLTFNFVDEQRPAITWVAGWGGLPKSDAIDYAATRLTIACPLIVFSSDE